MIVIGIHGAIGTGKSTVAKIIEHECAMKDIHFEIYPFAKELKKFASLLGWNGEKDEKGRRLLQLLGTECGRKCIHNNIWVDKWRKAVMEFEFHHPTGIIVCDDARFLNELIAIKAQAINLTVKLKKRAGLWHRIKLWLTKHMHAELVHESELGLPDQLFDHVIINDGTMEQLTEAVKTILRDKI